MDGLKQRVIGALVLISLAVIFIPMLFDEPHQERTSKVLPIPPKPALPTVQISEPKPLQLLSEVSPEETTEETAPSFVLTELDGSVPEKQPEPAVASSQAAEPVSPSKPQTPEKSPVAQPKAAPTPEKVAPIKTVASSVPASNLSDEAWTVQIGTFKNHENAYRLRDSIVKQGLKAYTQEISTDEGKLMRVFAGPVPSNDEAQALKVQVEKLVGMKSLVVRYKQ